MEIENYTEEFIKKSKPGEGMVLIKRNVDIRTHMEEISTANWLVNQFGGTVTILDERNSYNFKNPDYLWNTKYWELKDVGSFASLDKRIRKAFKQIKYNPGGIIIDLKNKNIINKISKSYLINRFNLLTFNKIIIIIKYRKKLINIYKITK